MTRTIILIVFVLAAQNGMAQPTTELVRDSATVSQKTRFLSRIKGNVGYLYSKIPTEVNGSWVNYDRHAINLNTEVNLYRDLYLRGNFFFDLVKFNKPVWLADYFYQLGVYNWRDYTFSYGYENYGTNRFSNGPVSFGTNLRRGNFFVKYKLGFTELGALKLDKTSRISVEPFFRIQPEYTNAQLVKAGNGKIITGATSRYTIVKNFYVEGAVYFYPVKDTKLPWNPDFSYGFGLFNWRPWKVNFSYGNFTANRFKSSEVQLRNYGFWNGDFKIYINYAL